MSFEDELDASLAGLDAADRELVKWIRERRELRAAARAFLATLADAAKAAGKDVLLPALIAAAKGLVQREAGALAERFG